MWTVTCLFVLAGLSFSPLQDSSNAAKAQSSSASISSKSGDTTTPVPATQPVLTVHGLCDTDASNTGRQKTCTGSRSMTREQLEALMRALNPDGQALPANARRTLAKTYTEYLAVETAVQKEGMENTSELREFLEWTRLRAITDYYRRSLQEKYKNPAAGEIEAYYHQHQADYERVKLVRILIPRESASIKTPEFDKKALQVAQEARVRAVKGDDPTDIQQDVYKILGLVEPMPVDLGSRKRADMLPEEAKDVFSLKPGEVTQVEIETKNYVVYKAINKDIVPLEEVKAEIARAIYQQKFREAMKAALDAVPAEFNQEYFGAETDTSKVPAAPSPSLK